MLAAGRGPVHHAALRRHTRPETGKRNVGMYRMQVYDGQTTGMHWQRQKNAAEHCVKDCVHLRGLRRPSM